LQFSFVCALPGSVPKPFDYSKPFESLTDAELAYQVSLLKYSYARGLSPNQQALLSYYQKGRTSQLQSAVVVPVSSGSNVSNKSISSRSSGLVVKIDQPTEAMENLSNHKDKIVQTGWDANAESDFVVVENNPIQAPNQHPSPKIITGPQGPQGPEGKQGLQGPIGPEGLPGLEGPPGKLTQEQEQAILISIYNKIKNDIKNDSDMRGPQGPQGPPGPTEKMPTFVLRYVDKNRNLVEERPFIFNKANNRFEVEIEPIHVQNFDANSKLVDEEKYPYPGPIKLRHGVKIPLPTTTGPST
jgi:hypothetical protein